MCATGEIFQLVTEPTVLCHHARCANNSSIGIELQGLGKHDLDKNTEQFESLVELVKTLTEKYKITPEFSVQKEPELRFYGIASHKQVDDYCCGHRLIKKRDVHQEYINRVAVAIS